MDLDGVIRGKRKRITTWPAEPDTYARSDLVARDREPTDRIAVDDLASCDGAAALEACHLCAPRHRSDGGGNRRDGLMRSTTAFTSWVPLGMVHPIMPDVRLAPPASAPLSAKPNRYTLPAGH
jgi:hypothetical protein